MASGTAPDIAVRNLQAYLRQLSYADPSITPPPVDGVLDSATVRAIREFQESRGLPVTGVADQLLWETLYAAYRASLAENAPPQRMEVFPLLPADFTLDVGSVGFPVAAVQFMLRELEGNYGSLLGTEVTGRFDENTLRAVMDFQRRNALPPNGKVDRATWNKITSIYNVFFTRFPIE